MTKPPEHPEDNLIARLQKATGTGFTKAPPSQQFFPNENRSSGRDRVVYVLLDWSGSMLSNRKREFAVDGARAFMKKAYMDGFRAGLISFGCQAMLEIDAQSEFQDQPLKIKNEGGTTNMSDAIEIARNKLSGRTGEVKICIVTDGSPNDREKCLKQASLAKEEGIVIMTIGTEDADHEFLAQLASDPKLATRVQDSDLKKGISGMSGLLSKKLII